MSDHAEKHEYRIRMSNGEVEYVVAEHHEHGSYGSGNILILYRRGKQIAQFYDPIGWVRCLDNTSAQLDRAIAALTPAPAPVEIEIPEGFTKWEGGVYGDFVRDNPSMDRVSTELEVILRDGTRCKGLPGGFIWNHEGVWNDIIAYRIIKAAPADEQDDDTPTEHISILTGDPAIEPESGLHEERPALNEAMQDERELPITEAIQEVEAATQRLLEPVSVALTDPHPADSYEPGVAGQMMAQPTEGYAPVTNPEADALARAHDYYSPEKIAERNKFNPFSLFRAKEDA